MKVYIYQADLLCEDCGDKCREYLKAAQQAPEDPDDEWSYDSDDYPKGPVEEGESDTPSYCSHCGEFLESTLTSEGRDYVRTRVRGYYLTKNGGHGPCSPEWRAHYADVIDFGLDDVAEEEDEDDLGVEDVSDEETEDDSDVERVSD